MSRPSVRPAMRQAIRDQKRPYYKRLLDLSPIAYWPLWESSGAVVYDVSPYGRHGAYGADAKAPTLGQPGIRDGRTAILFDGGDYASIYSASLNTAVNKQEGSLFVWVRVSAAGDWTDATARNVIQLGFGNASTEYVRITKTSTNNTMQWSHRVDANVKSISKSDMATTEWFQVGITWSNSNDRLRAYLNGIQVGIDTAAIGTIVNDLDPIRCHVGAQSTTPLIPWKGWAAHAVVFDRELTPTEILMQYNLSPK